MIGGRIIVDFQEHYMPLRKVLRTDLNEARKAGDSELVSIIRTLIAAIDNAEAVDISDTADEGSEVPRRSLTEGEIARIVLAESQDLRAAADDYEQHGSYSEAERLRTLALVADGYANRVL